MDLPLHDSRGLPLAPLPPRPHDPHKPTATTPRNRRAGDIHPLRALAHGAHRDEYRTLWPQGQCQLLLQPVPEVFGTEPGDAGVSGDGGAVQRLEGGVRAADCGHGVSAVDDGHGVAGQSG